jgi:hypothetical protein
MPWSYSHRIGWLFIFALGNNVVLLYLFKHGVCCILTYASYLRETKDGTLPLSKKCVLNWREFLTILSTLALDGERRSVQPSHVLFLSYG